VSNAVAGTARTLWIAAPTRARSGSSGRSAAARTAHACASESANRRWAFVGGRPSTVEVRKQVSSNVIRIPASAAAAISALPMVFGSAYGVPSGAWCR
jgi:hypothetical protein